MAFDIKLPYPKGDKRIRGTVMRRIRINNKVGCWEWTGELDDKGYGLVKGTDILVGSAHRMSWRAHYGKIPYGLLVCHTCDNPACCNPKHLYLGTAKDNNYDLLVKRAVRGEVTIRNTKVNLPRLLRWNKDPLAKITQRALNYVKKNPDCMLRRDQYGKIIEPEQPWKEVEEELRKDPKFASLFSST